MPLAKDFSSGKEEGAKGLVQCFLYCLLLINTKQTSKN